MPAQAARSRPRANSAPIPDRRHDRMGGDEAHARNGAEPPHVRIGLGDLSDRVLEVFDRGRQGVELLAQKAERRNQRLRKLVLRARQMRSQLGKATIALSRHDPELGQHRPQAVHQLGALLDLDQQLGVRHGYLRHLAAVIEPQPEVSK